MPPVTPRRCWTSSPGGPPLCAQHAPKNLTSKADLEGRRFRTDAVRPRGCADGVPKPRSRSGRRRPQDLRDLNGPGLSHPSQMLSWLTTATSSSRTALWCAVSGTPAQALSGGSASAGRRSGRPRQQVGQLESQGYWMCDRVEGQIDDNGSRARRGHRGAGRQFLPLTKSFRAHTVLVEDLRKPKGKHIPVHANLGPGIGQHPFS